jgi:hypothetical protein
MQTLIHQYLTNDGQVVFQYKVDDKVYELEALVESAVLDTDDFFEEIYDEYMNMRYTVGRVPEVTLTLKLKQHEGRFGRIKRID